MNDSNSEAPKKTLTRQQKWDQRYKNTALQPQACSLLKQFPQYLPRSGKALDFACGLGGNAIFLNQKGLEVSAWDFSQQAITRLNSANQTFQPAITTEVRDVFNFPPEENSFDVIVISYFLARPVYEQIKEALKPNGILYYQSHNLDSPTHGGPANTRFLLKDNELIDHFKGLTRLESFDRPDGCPLRPGQSGVILKKPPSPP